MWFRVLLLIGLLLLPVSARAQTWAIDFAAEEMILSPEGYRAIAEIGERARSSPGLWRANVELELDDGAGAPDGRDVWRLRAVLLELAEVGIRQARTGPGSGVFESTTPAFDERAPPARIVIRVERLDDDPHRLIHRADPIVYFASGDTDVSPENRFGLAYAFVGPGLASASARVNAHTDTAGNDSDNMRLSEQRAESVVRELIRLGLPPDRIQTFARGESQLAVPTADATQEPGNRRVTITPFWTSEPDR